MNNTKDLLKYGTGMAIRGFWKIFGLFMPKKKKMIVFDSFVGKQYSCNPRAIYEYMLKNADDNINYIWAFREPEKFRFLEQNKNTTVVKYHSLKHQYLFYRAGTIVFNWKKTYDLPSRKDQTIIQTWHGGGCYKKTGAVLESQSDFHNRIVEEEMNKVTHFISSSRYFTEEVIRNQYRYKGNVLECGMPRNDILINCTDDKIKDNIKDKLNISHDKFIILYAPTYRDSNISDNYADIDYDRISESVKKRFNKEPVVLFRGHYLSKKPKNNNICDVTDYFDMRDLLLISDMLISDYSSSIWDYSFTYRPCFLYTPDLQDYINGRGLDEDIYSWGFPVSLSNDELSEQILNFDENDFKGKMDNHHNKLVSFENGNATEQVCKLIINKIKEK